MNDRIRQLRRDLNLTQQEFADRLNIKRNTVATYETGKSNPSDAAVNLICREFNVSEPWLRTGEGEMFVAKPREDELADFISGLLRSRPDDIRRRFVTAISKLSTQEISDGRGSRSGIYKNNVRACAKAGTYCFEFYRRRYYRKN